MDDHPEINGTILRGLDQFDLAELFLYQDDDFSISIDFIFIEDKDEENDQRMLLAFQEFKNLAACLQEVGSYAFFYCDDDERRSVWLFKRITNEHLSMKIRQRRRDTKQILLEIEETFLWRDFEEGANSIMESFPLPN